MDREKAAQPSLSERIKGLSPEKQAILRQKIREKNLESQGQGRVIPRRPDAQKSPLSFAQQRLWFLDRFEESKAEYNVPYAWLLTGELKPALLEQAVNFVAARHESLRTRFVELDADPVQIVEPEIRVPLHMEDLAGLDAVKKEEAIREAWERELRQPFDLANGPVLRVKLLVLGEREHLLLLTFHHIAFDGWSLNVFNRELAAAYAALLHDQKPSLPELPLQYADYAGWQRAWLRDRELDRQLSYWKGQLASAPVLDLPSDRPRPPRQTSAGAKHSFELPPDLSTRLAAFNRKANATPFMTLLGAFQVLLARYSGQRDILVGTPIANRQRQELEEIIGFFVNTLVMRVDLSGNPGFGEVVAKVRKSALEAFQHQDLPFEKLVEELKPVRDLSRHPLFQVMFGVANTPPSTFQLEGLEVSQPPLPAVSTHFDLELHLQARGNGWVAFIYYSTALFDEQTILRLAGHYQTLLDSMLAEPEKPVWEVGMLTSFERRQTLVEWNNTEVDYPRDKCVHELFEAQAGSTPEAVAVVFGDKPLTYRQLDQRATLLARHLRGRGVGPGRLVGIFLERSLEMVVGVLGVLKAGGAYVPLDPAFPSARLAGMVDDARPVLLLTTAPLTGAVPPSKTSILLIEDTERPPPGTGKNGPAEIAPTAEDPAYVLYTSGSTGRPKGVRIPHRAAVNFLASMRKEPGLASDDVLVAVTTLSFDIAGLEIYLPLTTGARVVVASRDEVLDAEKLAQLLAASGATIMQATPATWRLLLQSGWSGSPNLKILCGGEALSPELAGRLLECGREVWNLYGPTETTIWSAVQKVRPGEPVVVGRPIANTQFYVVDHALQALPVGVPGELLIGGDGLAIDYLNRPDLTAEKFIPNPFDPSRSQRLYRTGDLCRHRSDGTLEFLGRSDHQVKIRGFRVELGEIEAAINSYQGVRQALALAREDQPGDQRLAAYIVPADPASPPSVLEIRDSLKRMLPVHMVPSAFVILEKPPLTPNGKVDRKALPAPDASTLTEDTARVEPRNETEQVLAAIWAETLGLPTVGVHDNFFDLGGHSLLTLRLQKHVLKQLGQKLALASFFQYPTVAGLAASLARPESGDHNSGVLTVDSKGGKTPLFCLHFLSAAQNLAKHLGDERRIYGVENPIDDEINEWRRSQRDPISLENLAGQYVTKIKKLEPKGPYHLAGYCFGGLLAFEVAQQLARQGDQVGALVFIDTIYHYGCKPLRWGGLKRFLHHGRLVIRRGPSHLRDTIRKVINARRNQSPADRRVEARRTLQNEAEVDGIRGRYTDSIKQMVINYHGASYDGDAMIFRTVAQPGSWYFDLGSDNGWKAVIRGRLVNKEINCGHTEVFKEAWFVTIAEDLRKHLSEMDLK